MMSNVDISHILWNPCVEGKECYMPVEATLEVSYMQNMPSNNMRDDIRERCTPSRYAVRHAPDTCTRPGGREA